MPPTLPTRLPLSGRNPRRLPFERRLRLWLLALAAPTLALAAVLTHVLTHSLLFVTLVTALLALVALLATAALFDQITRPLQTLSNVVAALREDDFSFRARGARRNDALGDLALEINTLAGTLQHQRASALDALTLVERVLTAMPSPVLAFDNAHRLRLLNPAAAHAFSLQRNSSVTRAASDLHLQSLLTTPDGGIYALADQNLPSAPPSLPPTEAPGDFQASRTVGADDSESVAQDPRLSAVPAGIPQNATRWSVRRSTFRLHGVPHTLFVLADVSSALREEERLAWQRLIRVLGHEINNSLTPIKSIAGSLRSHLPAFANLSSRPERNPRGGEIPLPLPAPNSATVTDPAQPPDPLPETPIQKARAPKLVAFPDFDRGLAVIEDRADSLNRFLQAYQRLSRLPAPSLRQTPLAQLAHRVATLETRLPIHLLPSPELSLLADPDQLQQLLINLLHNAVDAALAPDFPSLRSDLRHADVHSRDAVDAPPLDGESALSVPGTTPHAAPSNPNKLVSQPRVTLSWTVTSTVVILHILDNGPGLTNPANLFVPFYTTKPGGSGIGLVLAQQIVSAHRGTLTLTNRADHAGCQAEIRLPLFPA